MSIAIFGAGAIGGYMGARLALAGENVTLVARGAHLAAMQQHGLRLLDGDSDIVSHPRCVGDTREAGVQDYVIIALKANQVSNALPQLMPLIGPQTAVVTAQNGVPWWYGYGIEGPLQDRRIEAVDPGGRIWDAIGPERAIGCVVYPACEIEAPGVIRHIGNNDRFILGEPDGSRSERLHVIARALVDAGLRAPVRTSIRSEIWLKLWGNAVFNPVSVLTGATLEGIASHPQARQFVRAAMLEVQAIAEALGEKMTIGVDARIDGAKAVGAHKTSMLQDFEAGRDLELDAICTAVIEIARMVQVPAPSLEALDALVRLAAESRSLSR